MSNPGDNGSDKPNPPSRLPPMSSQKEGGPPARKERELSPGIVEIPITELEYLRFRATKTGADNLVLQEAKIKSDEKVCELSRQVLEYMKKEENLRTDQVYQMTGIETGDHVIQKPNGEFAIIRKKVVVPVAVPGKK